MIILTPHSLKIIINFSYLNVAYALLFTVGWKGWIQKSVPEICSFLNYLHFQVLSHGSIHHWYGYIIEDLLERGQGPISISVSISIPTSTFTITSMSISIYLYLFKVEKRNQYHNCSLGKYEIKINRKIFLYLNPCHIGGKCICK